MGTKSEEKRLPSPRAMGLSLVVSLAAGIAMSQTTAAAVRPVARTDANSIAAHRQLVEKAKAGGIDLYFLGDSITRRWGCTDPQWAEMMANWKQNFFGWNAANFGWGADRIENVLWRIENGELDGVNPKVIVLLAGTNDVGPTAAGQGPGDNAKVAEVVDGVRALLDACGRKAPGAKIILTGILPRNDNVADAVAVVPLIRRINTELRKLTDGKAVTWLDIGDTLAGPDGTLFDGMTVDRLHLSARGYQVWADALRPRLTDLLGPPAATDHAPPPTGDPSAVRPAAGS